jgi:tetratricopeptide (TPR) repeat protein
MPDNVDPLRPMTMTEVRFNECLDTALADAKSGIVAANAWRMEGGGYLARQCLGFAYAEDFDWTAAATAFAEAAREAEVARDVRAPQFWAQAGNAALAGDEFEKAVEHLNAALVQGEMSDMAKGEIYLDRARAYVAMGDQYRAKSDLAKVHELVPEDPLGWLLSATLARRMDDLTLARADIAIAARLAGDDPAVALELGNIAYAAGDLTSAQVQWQNTVLLAKDSLSGRAAQKLLDQLKGENNQSAPAPQ